jgi:hypothetical protein
MYDGVSFDKIQPKQVLFSKAHELTDGNTPAIVLWWHRADSSDKNPGT